MKRELTAAGVEVRTSSAIGLLACDGLMFGSVLYVERVDDVRPGAKIRHLGTDVEASELRWRQVLDAMA